MPARSTAALIATAPRSLAASEEKSPWNPPIGVRAAPTMTIGSLSHGSSHFVSLKSSRPISMRRISLVPAPISYSLASRHSRPVGYSLM